ncbi:hypothetical protein YTCETSXE_CDS0089 [Staphylococcus phage MVC_VPHSA2]|uniref:Minor capsid protein n=1 Tax=Staphylococcus phage MVC_VPHSA1 TaxID=3088876 RepID=A0ABZ0QZS2_9CAUD|nr:hypothetical protein FBHYGVHD_CDS0038 [Staphylococcus phage MVC_VPHSA1]WPF65045.1 hypothetical protein YTCETSXE_CDS0089 [Staphylococcus phage MVC_VPHSA2]
MMNSDELVNIITNIAQNNNKSPFVIATVSSSHSSGRPRLKFAGASSDSDITYPYLSSYTPAANDKVFCVQTQGTLLILGKIV